MLVALEKRFTPRTVFMDIAAAVRIPLLSRWLEPVRIAGIR